MDVSIRFNTHKYFSDECTQNGTPGESCSYPLAYETLSKEAPECVEDFEKMEKQKSGGKRKSRKSKNSRKSRKSRRFYTF